MAADFAIHSDGHGGTDIIYAGGGNVVTTQSITAILGGGSLVHEHAQIGGAAHVFVHHFGA